MSPWWRRAGGVLVVLLAPLLLAGCVIHRRDPFTPVPVTAVIDGDISAYLYAHGDPAGDTAWRYFPASGGNPMPWDYAVLADIRVRVTGNLVNRFCQVALLARHPDAWSLAGVSNVWHAGHNRGAVEAFVDKIPELRLDGPPVGSGYTVSEFYADVESSLSDLAKVMWEVPAGADVSRLTVAVGVFCGSQGEVAGFRWLGDGPPMVNATGTVEPAGT
jgi:hypothetical protein